MEKIIFRDSATKKNEWTGQLDGEEIVLQDGKGNEERYQWRGTLDNGKYERDDSIASKEIHRQHCTNDTKNET